MASLETSGIEELELSLEEVADIPDDILLAMLEAEGEVIATAQEQHLKKLSFRDDATRQLEGSITVTHKLKRGSGGSPHISVYPGGMRKDGKTRNAEVGFMVEYGAPRRGIAPRTWMRTANEEAADEAAQAAMRVYDAWLKRKGL